MERTQVYLPAAQLKALQREAKRLGTSVTELIRRIVADHLHGRAGVAAFKKEAVMSFVALGASGAATTSEDHDRALDEAFRAGAVR